MRTEDRTSSRTAARTEPRTGGAAPSPTADDLLLEDGTSFALLENSDKILLE
jgi:hypothetical protein